jgi:hypothetical protein
MLSRINRIGRKADWLCEITSINTGWRRFCKAFAKNLYDMFRSIIGHQLFSVERPPPLCKRIY